MNEKRTIKPELYEEPKIVIVCINSADIITTSVDNDGEWDDNVHQD